MLLVFVVCSTSAATAQLKLRGVIYSQGPVQVALSVETYSETHFLYLTEGVETEKDGYMVIREEYDFPWDIVKDYNHTLKFTDGTAEKIIFVDGNVPDYILPKQKFIINIDLTNPASSNDMLVIFWSLLRDEYVAFRYEEIEEIRRQCVDPSVYKGNSFFNLVDLD